MSEHGAYRPGGVDVDRIARAVTAFGDVFPPAGSTPRSAFVVGAPRSGTSWLMQMLCYACEVGFVDNLIARFFWYPELGVHVSRDIAYPKAYVGRSDYGRTGDISEPHEFGRFWRETLGYENMVERSAEDLGVDFGEATRRVDAIAAAFGRPTVHKTFLLGFHLADYDAASAVAPLWIRLRRDVKATAASILRMRVAREGLDRWHSLVPRSALSRTDPYEQVVAQVAGIDELLTRQLSTLPADRVVELDYGDLRETPERALRDIAGRLEVDLNDGALDTIGRAGALGKSRADGFAIDESRLEEACHAVLR